MDNRFTIEILEDIASLPHDDQVIDALRHAPRFVRELLVFAYGDHEIALPTGRMSTTPITFRAFVEGRDERMAVESSCGDLLATEAGKLRKLYVRGGHPTLTDKRRLELWRDTLERVNEAERELLESIRMTRELPGDLARITRELVEQAFPGLLEAPVDQPLPTEPYRCNPGILGTIPGEAAPSAVADPPAFGFVTDGNEETEADSIYREVYSRMIFPG
jgi:hypothetical protein